MSVRKCRGKYRLWRSGWVVDPTNSYSGSGCQSGRESTIAYQQWNGIAEQEFICDCQMFWLYSLFKFQENIEKYL